MLERTSTWRRYEEREECDRQEGDEGRKTVRMNQGKERYIEEAGRREDGKMLNMSLLEESERRGES